MHDLSIGYKDLHPNIALNFLMNRMAMAIPGEELANLGKRISSISDWVREMLSAAETAEAEGRLAVASKYYLGAEFYMSPDADGKIATYKKFLELYDRTHPHVAERRVDVPFEHGSLPAIDTPSSGKERGVVVAHSGFDGMMEEMYPLLEPIAQAGYRVIAFEGPGQGGALRLHGLHMPYDWEKPLAAVLDHFRVDNCTLIGMSLGGYLAPRAAAFEPRIDRVVSWGAMYNFFDCLKMRMGSSKHNILKTLLDVNARAVINRMLARSAARDETMNWAVAHGMHVSGTTNAFDFLQWMASLNLKDVCPRITQDVLITHGTEDHLVGLDQFHQQTKALTNARSVTTRLYSSAEHGSKHCQIGNATLVTHDILRWLDGLDRRDEEIARSGFAIEKAA